MDGGWSWELPPGFYTAREAAEQLGLTAHTVTNYVSGGVIEGTMLTLRGMQRPIWVIHESELVAYRARRDHKRAQEARNRALRADYSEKMQGWRAER